MCAKRIHATDLTRNVTMGGGTPRGEAAAPSNFPVYIQVLAPELTVKDIKSILSPFGTIVLIRLGEALPRESVRPGIVWYDSYASSEAAAERRHQGIAACIRPPLNREIYRKGCKEGRIIVLRDVPPKATEQGLLHSFGKYGAIDRISILRHSPHKHLYGLVLFESEANAGFLLKNRYEFTHKVSHSRVNLLDPSETADLGSLLPATEAKWTGNSKRETGCQPLPTEYSKLGWSGESLFQLPGMSIPSLPSTTLLPRMPSTKDSVTHPCPRRKYSGSSVSNSLNSLLKTLKGPRDNPSLPRSPTSILCSEDQYNYRFNIAVPANRYISTVHDNQHRSESTSAYKNNTPLYL